MSEKMFKNVNGNRIQMTDAEVKEFEASRVNTLLEDEAQEKKKIARKEVLESMRLRLGLSKEEVDILMNGF